MGLIGAKEVSSVRAVRSRGERPRAAVCDRQGQCDDLATTHASPSTVVCGVLGTLQVSQPLRSGHTGDLCYRWEINCEVLSPILKSCLVYRLVDSPLEVS